MQATIHQEGAVLVVQYDGQLTFKARSGVLDQVLVQLRDGGIRRILIDFTGAWPTREGEEAGDHFAARLAGARELQSTVIAYLNPPHTHGAPAELAAPVAGFRVQRFFNRKQALDWLRIAAGEMAGERED